ncbi:MAG: alpha/beta hydrolase, partial [Deltaproteobacteria bacterium]|nr:alpha/beta hydrolase [Deltaproteobacteria bacterium]
LVGDSDALIPPENSRMLADRIPGAEHASIPGCGHDFPADDPAESFRILDRFFDEPEGS